MCARAPVAAAALMTVSMARRSATGGLEATKASYPGPFGTLISAGSSACTIMGAPPAASSFIAARSSSRDSGGNSAIPESIRKHLNPTTPASSSGPIAAAFPGTAPPQNATSTAHCPAAAAAFSRSASTETVTGTEFSGMSQIVVTPPASAARVADANPSHSVRPGSLTCTCVSTSPGSRARSPRSTSRSASSFAS